MYGEITSTPSTGSYMCAQLMAGRMVIEKRKEKQSDGRGALRSISKKQVMNNKNFEFENNSRDKILLRITKKYSAPKNFHQPHSDSL